MKIIAYRYIDTLLDLHSTWKVEAEYIYEDIDNRQQLEQLLLEFTNNPPQRLLIGSLVELGDSLGEISDRLTQIESLGIEVITQAENYKSGQTPTNLAQLLATVHKQLHSRHLRQGHARKRLKTLPPPGKPPYGYRKGQDRYLIDRSTAPVVKDFFEQFLLYGCLRKAVRYLEKKYGKKIAVSTGHHWLTNPVYRGHLSSPTGEIILNTHNAILCAEEAAQIDRLLRRNRLLPPRSASASRSLAGLVLCQQCQNKMTITQSGKYLYMRTPNCPQQPKCKAIAYQTVLTATIEHICLDLPQAVSHLETEGVETLKTSLNQQINQKEQIIQQIPPLENQGILDQETANRRIYQLKTEIAQIKQRISQLPPINLRDIAQTVSLKQFWLDLSEAERRFYFREFIQHIEIHRGQSDYNLWELKLVFVF